VWWALEQLPRVGDAFLASRETPFVSAGLTLVAKTTHASDRSPDDDDDDDLRIVMRPRQ
jgi:hypothetical protein